MGSKPYLDCCRQPSFFFKTIRILFSPFSASTFEGFEFILFDYLRHKFEGFSNLDLSKGFIGVRMETSRNDELFEMEGILIHNIVQEKMIEHQMHLSGLFVKQGLGFRLPPETENNGHVDERKLVDLYDTLEALFTEYHVLQDDLTHFQPNYRVEASLQNHEMPCNASVVDNACHGAQSTSSYWNGRLAWQCIHLTGSFLIVSHPKHRPEPVTLSYRKLHRISNGIYCFAPIDTSEGFNSVPSSYNHDIFAYLN